jgi:hypothetical protein
MVIFKDSESMNKLNPQPIDKRPADYLRYPRTAIHNVKKDRYFHK